MKLNVFKIAIVAFMALAVVACKKDQNKTEAGAAKNAAEISNEAVQYTVDTDNSTLAWEGFKPTGKHNGTIQLSEGTIGLEDGKLAAGNFVIDMNSIKNLDIENEGDNAKLVGHLKSGDFFDVENHKFSVFTITGVEERDGKTIVKGNLTIKNIKKNIEFPATITVNGDEVNLNSEVFTIDRTEWDIKYKSGKFFDDLKDKFINDEIEFQVNIKARKS
ncbi:YceI family protein [Flavobacteriaceae bacterium F08102]|nr:YceI family protein [Flavobacteriaceae bacterium F08102]